MRSQGKPSIIRIRKLGAGLGLAGMLMLACVGSAFAGVGVIGFIGNPPSAPGYAGGEFSTTGTSPGGLAVNGASGDVYAVDRGNHRIQRFDSEGDFISAWGADVISGGAAGIGTVTQGSDSVTDVTTTSKAFLVGQVIEGMGILPDTRITAVGATTLTLSQAASPSATGTPTPLTVAVGAGNVTVNEVQTVSVAPAVTGGNFRLTFNAPDPEPSGASPQTTANIPYNAPAAEVQSALEALSNIGPGNIAVTSSNPGGGAGPGGPYSVEFEGSHYADTNVPNLTIAAGSPEPLTGGSATNAITIEGGMAYEVCLVATECKPGLALSAALTTVAFGGSLNSPQGVAINQSSGDLYVSNQALQRIEEFDESGAFVRAWGRNVVQSGPEQSDEQQRLIVDATAGEFRLTFAAATTGDLNFSATAAEVQSELNSLASIGGIGGNVTVSGGPGGPAGSAPYLVTFGGTLADTNLAPITISAGTTPLTGTATIAALNEGAEGFEICTTASVCQKGSAGGTAGAFPAGIGYPAVAPAGTLNAGNVLVGDSVKRVQEFSATGAFVRAFGWNVVASGPSETGTGFEVCREAAADICKAGAAGSGLGQFNGTGTAPTRVAEDSVGNIYTLENSFTFRVQRFAPAPNEGFTASLFNPTITPPLGEAASSFPLTGASAADSPTEIAVDPSNDHVYVGKPCSAARCPAATDSTEHRVYEFRPGDPITQDLFVDTHLVGYGVLANGLAVKAGGKPAYLSTSTPNPGVFIAGDPIPPHVTLAPTTAVSSDAATLNGHVNPEGGGPLHSFYHFEYSPDGGSTWLRAPAADVDIGSDETPVPVSQTVHGLQPNRDYKVRLVATKSNSPTVSIGSDGDFKTDPAPPRVETFVAFWDQVNPGLVLRAGVNPNNTATTFQFEYGTEPCATSSCQLTPSSSAGAGGEFKEVRSRVSGLEPETTYHYRAIAENGVGAPVVGGEGRVTTPSLEEACPNEEFRTGASAQLPECRAYEWVSNGDTWGTGLAAGVGSIADSGDRAQFFAQTFGQPESSPAPVTPYLTERAASGWRVGKALPDPNRSSGSFKGEYRLVSADLGAVLWPEATAGERIAGEMNWTSIDINGSRDPAVAQISPVRGNGAERDGAAIEYEPVGAAGDLSSFVFSLHPTNAVLGMSLFQDEPVLFGQQSNLYEVSGIGPGPGTLDIINRGGAVGPENPLGLIGGVCGAGLGGRIDREGTVRNMARAISADGSVAYFSARPNEPLQGTCTESSPKRLYKRVDHATTVAVSEPQCTPTPVCPDSPEGDDEFQGASRDGEVVYFTTLRRLTNSDTDDTADLYLYDASSPAGGPSLVQVSAGGGGEALGALDSSADGSRVYFAADGVLSGSNTEGRAPVAGEPNLYVYERDDTHPSGRIAFVGSLSPSRDSAQWALGEGRARSSHALPNQGQAADGHLFLFVSAAQLLSEDLDTARDLYRYDDVAEELLCLSCMGQEEGANVRIAARSNGSSLPNYVQAARPASADGSTVVFITKENLVDEDLNGAFDVYIWREGALGLASAGSGSEGVALVPQAAEGAVESGISPDGNNVFFVTSTALVSADRNNGLDLYDARVGGGFAEVPVVPDCAGEEGCRGLLPIVPPPSGGTGSEAAGPGNPPGRKPCGKRKVRKGGKCVPKSKVHKKKSHKKKKRHRKRGADQRGGKR